MKSAIPFHLSCRQAAHLMLTAQDRPLAWKERTDLKIHLWICKNCPRFQQQLSVLERSLSDWRHEVNQTKP